MSDRAIRTALAAVGAFALGYLVPAALRLPVLVYDPLARTAFFSSAPSGVQMRYFGDLLWATTCALLGIALARAWRPRSSIAVAAATALSLVAFDVVFYVSRFLAALR
jgi:hypothetical protein